MSVEGLIDGFMERQAWLDPVADVAQEIITSSYELAGEGGRQLKNALHGTWLGHPLHPVLTDATIGFWLSAALLDLLDTVSGRDDLAVASDAAVGAGLLSALATAAAGLTDWQHVDGRARRTGLVHGLLNVTGTALYAGSWLARTRGNRAVGKQCAWLGFAVLNVSAYLGGHLVFGEQIGVDHSANVELPDEFVAIMSAEELKEGQPTRAMAGDTPIVLVRQGGLIYALAERCSHLGGPLSEGLVEDGGIVCPWHGSRFALEDGSVLDGPSTYQQPCLQARIRNGQIEVRAAVGV
jgi:nitrite reductase/ring-hydroxylating ferredoxin subunit/uncharacterized membrane protein